jgi:hypothetical protein
MVALTREERQRRVLELHNQSMGTRKIAQIPQMSFRDIGVILKDADEKKEVEQQQKEQEFESSRAYKLFSEGKSPVQVAIELNIRAQQAIIFQREYWDLKGIHELNQIYEDIKDDPGAFVKICRLTKNAGKGPQHVNRLLEIANNDLPALEWMYERLEHEVKSLEFRRSNLMNNVNHYHSCCEKEMMQMNRLSNERMRLQASVSNFKNTNEEYLKIKKTVEQKVMPLLTGSKKLLRYALISLIETMKKNPDKYSSLVYPDLYSSAASTTEYQPDFFTYGQDQQLPLTDWHTQACIEMVVEEADGVYNKLKQEWIDGSVTDYSASATSSSPSLPPPSDEK